MPVGFFPGCLGYIVWIFLAHGRTTITSPDRASGIYSSEFIKVLLILSDRNFTYLLNFPRISVRGNMLLEEIPDPPKGLDVLRPGRVFLYRST